MKVKLYKNQENYFRKLARNSPLEIQAVLLGTKHDYGVKIEKFIYPKKYYEQTESSVQWFQEDYELAQELALSKGWTICGDCHSHPEWDAVPSRSDYKAHVFEGHAIMGICSTFGRSTRTRYWVADSCVPCTKEYL